jgi:hypothetical protein
LELFSEKLIFLVSESRNKLFTGIFHFASVVVVASATEKAYCSSPVS